MAFAAIYITCSSQAEAESIATQLVQERLAACGNVFPITSVYWWDGKVTNDQEHVALVKTSLDSWEALKSRAEELHAYDVPCIMKMEVEANQSYEEWISKETRRDL